ncbi:MAG: hypothetical protein JW891_01995 [Candidatus Lokiarchaeota archaeon]|nr:hypothetical protein [Candidatus Lokiarchaeota archaeon]
MEGKDYVECSRCGRELRDSKAIYINCTPFCERCHGEFDFDEEDEEEEDNDDD